MRSTAHFLRKPSDDLIRIRILTGGQEVPSDFGVTDQGIILFSKIFPFNQALAGIIAVILVALMFSDVVKYLRYRTREETLELAALGAAASAAYFFTGDLLLSALIFLFVSMVMGTISVRKSEIWFKMTLVFTITYGYVLGGYILGTFIIKDERIFGVTWVSSFWVLLILSFVVFGRRYLLVSRFMSPNYVYLFLYILVYIFILQIKLPWEWTYVALLLGNTLIYCLSGWLLTFLFRVKPLDDPHVNQIVTDISTQLHIKVRKVGVVQAPILNAFAYGPFFDQRIAFIAEDLSIYDADEIKGITAHELAHLKRKHTLQLLVLSAVELLLKWIVGAPASYIDYAVRKDVAWNFLDFYVFNFAIFVILLIYVRVLEAEADEITQKLGFGKELAAALYHLESFYQGIAGSMGLSVHLLTEKKRPSYQVIIDAGDAARQITNHAMKASRMALLTNLIMSHPPSAFRIVGVLHPDKFSKYKLALLPLFLLIPRLRNRYLRQISAHWKEIDELLTENYEKMGHSLEEYVELSLALQQARVYIGKEIFALPAPMADLPVVHGIVKRVKIGNTLLNSVILEVEDAEKEGALHEVSYFAYSIVMIEPGTLHYLKTGQLSLLTEVTFHEKKRKLQFEYVLIDDDVSMPTSTSDLAGKNKKITNYLGFPLSSMLSVSPDHPLPIIYRQGSRKFTASLISFQLKPRFRDATLQLSIVDTTSLQDANTDDADAGDESSFTKNQSSPPPSPSMKMIEKTFQGRDVIITRGMMAFDAQSLVNVFPYLKDHQVPLYLFLVSDPDNYIPCLVEECSEETLTVKVGKERLTHSLKEIDGALIEWPDLWQIQPRKELGILGMLSRRLANRGTVPSFLK